MLWHKKYIYNIIFWQINILDITMMKIDIFFIVKIIHYLSSSDCCEIVIHSIKYREIIRIRHKSQYSSITTSEIDQWTSCRKFELFSQQHIMTTIGSYCRCLMIKIMLRFWPQIHPKDSQNQNTQSNQYEHYDKFYDHVIFLI